MASLLDLGLRLWMAMYANIHMCIYATMLRVSHEVKHLLSPHQYWTLILRHGTVLITNLLSVPESRQCMTCSLAPMHV